MYVHTYPATLHGQRHRGDGGTGPQWRRQGGQARQLAPPPPTSDRTPREIDADPRRFFCPKKMGVGYRMNLLRSFTCTDATADVLWSYDYEKEGVEEVVEGVTLVGPR